MGRLISNQIDAGELQVALSISSSSGSKSEGIVTVHPFFSTEAETRQFRNRDGAASAKTINRKFQQGSLPGCKRISALCWTASESKSLPQVD